MSINNQIREAVIADLTAVLGGGFTYFNGRPASVEVSTDPDTDDQLPAVAVFVDEGKATNSGFGDEEWSAVLHVEIFQLALNDMDSALDAISDQILQVITRHYDASGILAGCDRSGFNYTRDDEQPWGTLDLTFDIEWETE